MSKVEHIPLKVAFYLYRLTQPLHSLARACIRARKARSLFQQALHPQASHDKAVSLYITAMDDIVQYDQSGINLFKIRIQKQRRVKLRCFCIKPHPMPVWALGMGAGTRPCRGAGRRPAVPRINTPYASATTSVPMVSPDAARTMLCGSSSPKTTMGMWLFMQMVMAVLSITFRSLLITSI